MLKKLFKCSLLVVVALTLIVNCSYNSTSNESKNPTSLQVSFPKSALTEEINLVNLFAESGGEEYSASIVLDNKGEFSFEEFDLPAGELLIKIDALDADDRVLFNADTTVEIIASIVNEYTIEMLPVISMVKLSPYAQSVLVESNVRASLEIFNIDRFFQGAFKVGFDPDMVNYESISQADTSWGELILHVENLGDTLIVSASRLRGKSDEIPDGTTALLELNFIALTVGSTTLDLEVTTIEDLEGTISELSTIYVDNSRLTITSSETISARRDNQESR